MSDTTTETAPPAEAPRPRRLRRSQNDRMIAGVAGGIGEYFKIDPVLVRIGFVALALFGGAGLIVYPVAWVLVPDYDGRARGIREILKIGAIVVSALAVSFGLFLAAATAAGFGGGTAVAIAVLVAGVLLFAAAFGGRRARWLILPAFAVAIGATAVAAADVDLHGGFKDTTLPYTRADALQRSYRVGAGHLELDLRAVKFPPGDTRIDARVGAGELEVLVPPDVCVATESSVGVGAVTWFGHTTGGTDLDVFTAAAERGKPRLVIKARVGAGHLDIGDHVIRSFDPSIAGDACETAKSIARPH
jgi:phage shock protein PspC (stress-responsive transcriptional regulator)/predicted membrane protein